MCIEVLRALRIGCKTTVVFADKRYVWMLPDKGKEARRLDARVLCKAVRSQSKWVLDYI